jgi:endonuclease YncB( thermonuclease family)
MSFFNRFSCLSSKKKDIQNIEWKDTVPFVPPINAGCVVKVYDGDTITIASKMPYKNSPMYRFSVRLRGIDSPEIKGKTAIEKDLAYSARDALANKLLGKNIILKNVSLEKYGRLLADVYFDGLNMNQWMLDNKLALPYDGGTKYRPSDWDDIDLDKK